MKNIYKNKDLLLQSNNYIDNRSSKKTFCFKKIENKCYKKIKKYIPKKFKIE
jgi:hypothetical protein